MKLQERIITLFDTHPAVDVFYMTSDEQFFAQKEHAEAQAQRLKVRGVAMITRDEVAVLKAQIEVGDPTLKHPDSTTELTAEELAQQLVDDAALQATVNKQLEIGADAASTDAPSNDAASTDAASTDAASTDAASTDAASTDAPSNDAASTDAASTDAASNDAASTDAASNDAASTDAASTDAASAKTKKNQPVNDNTAQ